MAYRIPFLRILLLISIFILIPGESLCQEIRNNQPLTLEESIQIALKNSLKIQSALKELASSNANIKKKWAEWLPHLYLTINSDYNKTEFSERQKSIQEVPSWIPEEYKEVYKNIYYAGDSKGYTNNINIGVTQLLLDDGKVSANISIAQIQHSIARVNLELIKENLVYEVSKSYYELFKYSKMMELTQKLLNLKEGQLKLYEDKLQTGVTTTPIVLTKKLDVLSTKNDLINVEGMYKRNAEEFLQLLNLDALPKFDFDIIPNYIPYEYQLKEVISYALENNLQIQQQQLEVVLKEKEINLARSGRKISAMMSGNYGYQKYDEDFKESVDDFNKNWNVKINIVWPLFTGGAVISDIKESSNKYSAVLLSLEDLKKEITSNIRQKYLKIKTLENRIELLLESEKIAKELLSITQTQYEAGITTKDDLCDKQIVLNKIILENIEALFDHQIAKIELCQIAHKEIKERK